MSVEFLPGDDPGPDADAPPPPGPGRYRWAWLAGAVLVAGALVWTVTRPTSLPAPRPARPSASPSPHRVVAVPAPECTGVPDCSAHTGVPAAITRLVRAYLPLGVRLHVRSVIEVDSLSHRNLLVARDLNASIDSVTVEIRVARGGPQRQAIVPDPPGFGSLLLHRINSGFVVRLQYLAPETVPPQLARLRALMSDPRLAAA